MVSAATGRVPMVRGTGLLATRAYIEKRHGADTIAQALARLAPAVAAPINCIPMAHEWYPEDSVLGLIDAVAAVKGDAVYDEMGRFSAEYDLNFIHRFLLRFKTPIWLLDRGARLWSEYHNTGRWKITAGEDGKSLIGELEDFGVVRASFCRAFTAWLLRAGQITGAKNFVVEHSRCRATSTARACVWEGHW